MTFKNQYQAPEKAQPFDPAAPSPMPEANRERIHDLLLGMKAVGSVKRYSEEEMAKAVEHLWPGVRPTQIRGVIARLALTAKRTEESRYFSTRAPAVESG